MRVSFFINDLQRKSFNLNDVRRLRGDVTVSAFLMFTRVSVNAKPACLTSVSV